MRYLRDIESGATIEFVREGGSPYKSIQAQCGSDARAIISQTKQRNSSIIMQFHRKAKQLFWSGIRKMRKSCFNTPLFELPLLSAMCTSALRTSDWPISASTT